MVLVLQLVPGILQLSFLGYNWKWLAPCLLGIGEDQLRLAGYLGRVGCALDHQFMPSPWNTSWYLFLNIASLSVLFWIELTSSAVMDSR